MPTDINEITAAYNNQLLKEHFPSHYNPQDYQTVNGVVYFTPQIKNITG